MTRGRRRETGTGQERHLRRTAALAEELERARVEDVLVETDRRTPGEVVEEVLTRSGWLGPVEFPTAAGSSSP
jgi:hypothetical protein